jgi:hypothetical protein
MAEIFGVSVEPIKKKNPSITIHNSLYGEKIGGNSLSLQFPKRTHQLVQVGKFIGALSDLKKDQLLLYDPQAEGTNYVLLGNIVPGTKWVYKGSNKNVQTTKDINLANAVLDLFNMHEESYNGEIPLVCSGWDRVSKGHELSEELQGERGLVSLTFSLIMPKNVVSQKLASGFSQDLFDKNDCSTRQYWNPLLAYADSQRRSK